MWRPNCRGIIARMSVFCGIAGWVDKSLIDSRLFYPLAVKTSGDRLRFYATQFSLVEVDTPAWLDASHRDGTLAFLRSRDIPFVAVDVPEGHRTSMPRVFEATSSKLAVIRFHGRNHETWDLKGVPPNVRFRYDYSDQELQEGVPRIKEMWRS